jgi:hypothetical protein
MGGIEAAGELVTGALLGRAMEPHAGEGGEGHGSICLNCGTALIGPHCHRCGQSGHLHRTLGAILHEILHGVFHFEGKLWRTLPMLAWRPGELTRRYIEGERARFVSPMAIFLFSIFTMFAVFSWAGISAPSDIAGFTVKPAAAVEQAKKDAFANLKDAQEEIADPDNDAADKAKYQRRLDTARSDLQRLDAAGKLLGPDRPDEINVHTNWHALDHGIEKWKKNPSLMLYKLQSSSYKFSWLLIPLSLPFLWALFFWKRGVRLYDHAIFITYSIAFMSILFVGITLARAAGLPDGWIAAASTILPFAHIWLQLQQAYRLRWWSAGLRAVVLSMLIVSLILPLFLLALLLMGMF